MSTNKKILAIIGSASAQSSNERLVEYIARLMPETFHIKIYTDLKSLPHFDPALSAENPPREVIQLREAIAQADGILICTPEYVYSIPSGLKNAIEWCVSTTVFSNKPIGLITASAGGEAAHAELKLIMKTVLTRFTEETTLLIRGVKGKINAQGQITDNQTGVDIEKFVAAFLTLCGKEPRITS